MAQPSDEPEEFPLPAPPFYAAATRADRDHQVGPPPVEATAAPAFGPVPAPGQPVLVPGLLAAIVLLVAITPLDYGYYIFLRIVVTIAAIWVAIAAGRASQGVWVSLGVTMAIVFNPLIPVWLSKGVWIPIDLAGAVLMAIAAFRVHGARRGG